MGGGVGGPAGRSLVHSLLKTPRSPLGFPCATLLWFCLFRVPGSLQEWAAKD